MLKHKISQQELDAAFSLDAIVTRSLSVYKTLPGKNLKRGLSQIIFASCSTLRVLDCHTQSKTQRKIVYMGYQSDVDFGSCSTTANAMKFHAGQHLKLDHDSLTSSQKQNQRRALLPRLYGWFSG